MLEFANTLELTSTVKRLTGGDTKAAPTADDKILLADAADLNRVKTARLGSIPGLSVARPSFIVSLPIGISDSSPWTPDTWKRINIELLAYDVLWYRSNGSVYAYPGVDLTGVTSFKLIVSASVGNCPLGLAFRLAYIDGRDGIDHNPLPLGGPDAYQSVLPPQTSVPPAPSAEFAISAEQRLSCARIWPFWRAFPLGANHMPDDYVTVVSSFNVQFYY